MPAFFLDVRTRHSLFTLGGRGCSDYSAVQTLFSSTGLHAADSFFPGLNFFSYISTNGAETSVRLKEKIISAHLVSKHPQNK